MQFCDELVDTFNFHHFDNLKYSERKSDPRRGSHERYGLETVTLMFAANAGDKLALERMLMQGVDFKLADYDDRTALHVAAAQGHLDCVKFLVEVAGDDMMRDRWGFTAQDEAQRFGHDKVVDYLNSHLPNVTEDESP